MLTLLHAPTSQVDTEEYPVDYLNIAVAQRYSVLVTARNDTSQNFLVHANFDDGMFDTVPDGLALSSSQFSMPHACTAECRASHRLHHDDLVQGGQPSCRERGPRRARSHQRLRDGPLRAD